MILTFTDKLPLGIIITRPVSSMVFFFNQLDNESEDNVRPRTYKVRGKTGGGCRPGGRVHL